MPVPCAVRGVEVPHGRIVAEFGFADHIVLVYAILVLVVVLELVALQQLAQLLEGASGCFRVGLAVVENVAFHRALPVDIRLSFPTSLGIQRGRGLRLGYIRWKRIAVHQFKGEILDGRLVFLTSSNIVGMIIMCLCPLSLGFSLNLLFAQRQATATLRQRLDREHTARHLHDTISNDLAYMILRIDQASRSDCPADREQYQRQLTDLRAIAETALDHTHQVIRQLERTDKPDDRSRIVKTNNDDKTDRKIEQQRERLDGIIQSQRRRLGGLGFQGDDILGTFDHPLADDILDLLEGLLNELYANIAKHAAPHEWYAVTISFDRRHVIISASDVLKDEAVRLGLGSGLKRYRTVIESMSGTFDITDDSGNWNANITIPLSVTRR